MSFCIKKTTHWMGGSKKPSDVEIEVIWDIVYGIQNGIVNIT